MGLFENREYFERIEKLTQNDESEDLRKVSTKDLHAFPNPFLNDCAVTTRNPLNVKKTRIKVFLVLKISITLLVGAMIVQTLNMVAVFGNAFSSSSSSSESEKFLYHTKTGRRSLNTVERSFILTWFLLSLALFIWMSQTIWSKRILRLFVSLSLNIIQLFTFILIPIVYFNREIDYQDCSDKYDCMRYTVPIVTYIVFDIVLLLVSSLLVIYKINQYSRRIKSTPLP